MTIAVDFDGTIVEHRYPDIGKELPFAIATLRQLQQERPDLHLILWTVREGALLQQAVEWCEKRGLTFFAVNSNYPGELMSGSEQGCRKVNADIYIDDRNLGGAVAWPEVYRRIIGKEGSEEHGRRQSFFSRIFGS